MELTLTASRQGKLSSFLKNELKMSTGLMNRVKWADGLRVNGLSVHTNHPVLPGDRITVLLQEEEPEYPAEEGDLRVLYEDDHILAVDKPAGMLIHPSRNRIDGTLANLVQGHYRQWGVTAAFHPLTRLDRDTFGIVLIAKNSHIHGLLQQGHTQKTYHARVFGGPEGDAGTIDAPIARKALPSLLREIRPDGKPSVTRFQVLAREGQTTRLALEPVTGRTHQLRLHCAYMGYPILGDPQYGTAESQAYSLAQGIGTQLLCAKRIQFSHPITGEAMCLESEMDV